MATTEADCKAAEDYARQHKDQIIADARDGCPHAKAVISIHQMLVRHADWPTWGMFMGAVDQYRKSKTTDPRPRRR